MAPLIVRPSKPRRPELAGVAAANAGDRARQVHGPAGASARACPDRTRRPVPVPKPRGLRRGRALLRPGPTNRGPQNSRKAHG